MLALPDHGSTAKVQSPSRVIAPEVRRVGTATRNRSTFLAEVAVREDPCGIQGPVSVRPREVPRPPEANPESGRAADDAEHPRAVRRAVSPARRASLPTEVPLRCASGRRDPSGGRRGVSGGGPVRHGIEPEPRAVRCPRGARRCRRGPGHPFRAQEDPRSEEHTSELQSPYDLVCRLLLEKKKKKLQRQI